jgi:hypothetical protein
VIALSDFPHNRTQFSEAAVSLAGAQIEVWWFDQWGTPASP